MPSTRIATATAFLLACVALALTLNTVAQELEPSMRGANGPAQSGEAPAQATQGPTAADAGQAGGAQAGPGGYVGYTGRLWTTDFGISRGRCNRAAVEKALADPAAATPGNAPVAILAGLDLDDTDRACAALALELARNRRTVAWSSGSARHVLTASRDAVHDKQPCRGFVLRITGASARTVRGLACQPEAGVWSLAAR